ncbi:MAG: hypothetical protein ACM31N_09390 [Deltaproteobacteria bacterium]
MKKSLLAALAFLLMGTAVLQGCFVGWHNHDRRHHRHDGFHDGFNDGSHDGDRPSRDDRSRGGGDRRHGDD